MARPQHENAGAIKKRELALSHWKGAIMRAGSEPKTVEAEVRRALADPLVREDSKLAGELREFADHRINEVRQLKPPQGATWDRAAAPTSAAPSGSHKEHRATEEEVRTSAHRLLEQFENYASHYFEPESRSIAERLRAMHLAFPQWVNPAHIRHCEEVVQRLTARRAEFDEHVETLHRRLIEAAKAGEHEVAAKTLQRLSSIHAMHPQILSDDRFAEIRDEMAKVNRIHEHRVALEALISRERRVTAELKQHAAAIHAFHQMARTADHDGEDYRRAEAAYRQAVRAIRSRDSEWMSAMILELLDLLGDWTHPPPKVEKQLDRFIAAVRGSLAHLRREISKIQKETGDCG